MQDTVFLDAGALHPGDFFGEVSFLIVIIQKWRDNAQELKRTRKRGIFCGCNTECCHSAAT
jgi:hypothetical protein